MGRLNLIIIMEKNVSVNQFNKEEDLFRDIIINMKDKSSSEDKYIDYNSNWDDLKIHKDITNSAIKAGFLKPSKIQIASISNILNSRSKNLIAQAPNGSGKTGSFVIAGLSVIDQDDNMIQVIIISPTRELTKQNHNCT